MDKSTQIEDERPLLTPGEVQKLFPGPDKSNVRWISKEAQRLGCGRRMGKAVFIRRAALDHLFRGAEWEPSEREYQTEVRVKDNLRSITRGKGQKGKKTARSSTDDLSEALALVTGKSRSRKQEPSNLRLLRPLTA